MDENLIDDIAVMLRKEDLRLVLSSSPKLSEKVAGDILALIEQAGYKSPEEVKAFGNKRFQEGILQAGAVLETEGYVKLADDQTLPQSISNEFLGEIVVMGVEAMKKEWRKVILSKE